jgi:ribosomal protein L44E
MKIPKIIKRFCIFCKKHTEQKVAQSKKGQPRSMSRGSKYRARDRGLARGIGGFGRYSKPAITKWKMTGAKLTKKTDLRYECKVCHKKMTQSSGIRAKKVEFV